MTIPKTDEVRIETSTRCNYNCVMCPRDSFRRKKEVMSNNLFRTIIEKLQGQNLTKATLSGFGEFSMDPGWKYKLNMLSKNFETTQVITNLSLLSYSDIDFILDKGATIRVSLYALDEQTFHKVHCPPIKARYEDIVTKVGYIVGKNRDQITLSYIELEENKHQTQDWIKWIEGVRADVWKPHNWTGAKVYRKLSEDRLTTCGRPFNGPIQIQVDGTVNVCCFDYNGEIVIGDLKVNSLKEIYNGWIMDSVQKLHRENNHLPLCLKCDQLNKSKADELIFTTHGDKKNRVKLTSTNYENINSV